MTKKLSPLELTFRLTIALCFIGHGAWGVIGKAGWVPFFTFFNFDVGTAHLLMPLIGVLDIVLGICIFLYPTRACLIWMVIWCIWTALLRPLSGQSMWEVWERAGNYGMPFAFLMITGPFHLVRRDLFGKLQIPELSIKRLHDVKYILRLFLFLLLLGHGGFGAILQKPQLFEHYQSVGLGSMFLVKWAGVFEMTLAFLVLFFDFNFLLVTVLVWKIFTEFLHITSGPWVNVFEFIERAGDYGIPIALLLLNKMTQKFIDPQSVQLQSN